eukprot:GFYU01016744.1.p1 GENE.GFYU01016744.1~~GFYU01016744.1.p1  ORF type:complete len:355 (-),score=94.46 GFYU01016744.1:247-1245(-)
MGPAASLSTESSPDHEMNVCRLTSLSPDACISMLFGLVDDLPGEHVTLQFVAEFTNSSFQRITRVNTVQMPLTGKPTNFVKSTDPDVAAILIGKKTALDLRSAHNSIGPLSELDTKCADMAKHFGEREKSRFGWSSLYLMPKELELLPRKMYLLRRGPVLGTLLQHVDDIDAMRTYWMTCNFEDSRRLVNPSLLSVQPDGSFEELPLENLALQSERVLVLDHHSHILVWSGMSMVGPPGDALRQHALHYAQEASKRRFPAPRIVTFNEGTSMARFIECRLIPAHKDSQEDQVSSFPQLSQLADGLKSMLVSKFVDTSDQSFHEWYRSLFRSY